MTKGRTLGAALLALLALLWVGVAPAQSPSAQCVANAYAQGTPDAITIAPLPCGTTTNLLLLTASGANTSTTPTLQQIGSPAQLIVRPNGDHLVPGDIQGAGYVALLSSTGSTWVLLNPNATTGGGSVNAGLAGNVAIYPSNGATVGPLANGTSAQVLTGGATPTWAQVTAAQMAAGAAAGNGAVPHVPNLGALRVYPTTYGNRVHRDGYSTPGDGGGADYTYSASACTANAGGGDDGDQVAASGGGCWIADAVNGELDIRVWGAQADGVTDASTAINSALTFFGGVAVVPPTTNGFYIASTIQLQSNTLRGVSFQATNTWPGLLYPGTSWLKCARAVNPCVRLSTTNTLANAPQLENLLIVGVAGVPTPGVVGLQFAGGFNLSTRNVAVLNFDTCVIYGPEGSTEQAGITTVSYNLQAAFCHKHYFVVDGWAEVKNIGGRAGMNGAGDYSTPDDFVYITHSTNVTPGGGPNTIMFDDFHFNPGDGGPGCAFNWGGFTGTGGVSAEYRLTNVHAEWNNYTGGGKTGVFCSDSTVTNQIHQLFVTNMLQNTSNITMDLFNLDPNTYFSQAYFDNNVFGCAHTTYTPAAATSDGDGIASFKHNLFCGALTFAANANINVTLEGNTAASLTLSGSWLQFTSTGDRFTGGVTDTATGHVAWSNPYVQSWTPTLVFAGGGTPTYTTQTGDWIRTANGGLKGWFRIVTSNIAGASGAATITGFPKSCAGNGSGQPIQAASGMAVTGAISTAMIASTLNLYQSSAAGQAVLTDANFGTAITLSGMFECLTAN